MARTVKPLSAKQVSKAKQHDKQYHLYDGGGLALRINPNGSKLWVFNYRKPYTNRRTNLGIGAYPETSLADARSVRALYRELLAKKIDPKSYNEEQEQSQIHAHTETLEKVARRWLEIKRSTITQDHAKDICRSLELHIFPALGDLPIHRIVAPVSIEVLQRVANRGNLETVKRLCQRLNEIMVYAVNTGIAASNPLAGIGSAFEAPAKEHLPTIQPSQLPILMQELSRARINIATRCLIEWQLHTMSRPSEAAGTRWDELDLQACLWHIPASRMKTRKQHSVPLSAASLALLELMASIGERGVFVFPSSRNIGDHINSQTANMALRRMGYGGLLVAHGLRSLASTTLNEQGFDAELIEVCLSHIDKNQVRDSYNHAVYLGRRVEIMDWWSSHIEMASKGDVSLAGSSQRILRAAS